MDRNGDGVIGYILAIGDVVSVKLWGAYEFEKQLTIDSQGNIFLPKVGGYHMSALCLINDTGE